MKLIVACGDSNTAGYEIIGGEQKPFPEKSWSAKLGSILNTQVENISQPGVSNAFIYRKCIDWLLSNINSYKPADITFLVMWSDDFRFEIQTPDTPELVQLTSSTTKDTLHCKSIYYDDILQHLKTSLVLRSSLLTSLNTVQLYFSLVNTFKLFKVNYIFCNGITSILPPNNEPETELQKQYNTLLTAYQNSTPFEHLGLLKPTDTFHNYSKEVMGFNFAENTTTNHWGENAHQAYAQYIYSKNKNYLDNVTRTIDILI